MPLEDVFGSAAPIADSRIQGDGPEGRLPLMACQDLAGTGYAADFDWFEYRERPYVVDVSQLELL